MIRKSAAGWLFLAALVLGAAAAPPALAGGEAEGRGFVDGSFLIELAGEEAVSVEVSLEGALLRAILKIDPELARIASGLQSIHAVILEGQAVGPEARAKIVQRMTALERRLRADGWQRVAKLREDEGELRVLMLGDDEDGVQGLVAVAFDAGGGEIVFTNLAGRVDLAAIEALGAQLDLPGLDALGGN